MGRGVGIRKIMSWLSPGSDMAKTMSTFAHSLSSHLLKARRAKVGVYILAIRPPSHQTLIAAGRIKMLPVQSITIDPQTNLLKSSLYNLSGCSGS